VDLIAGGDPFEVVAGDLEGSGEAADRPAGLFGARTAWVIDPPDTKFKVPPERV